MESRISINEAYTILGLSQGTPLDQVKVAYKQLALKTHPDKNPNNPEATTRFQQISEAYDKLLRHLDDSYSDASGMYDDTDSEDDIPLSFYVFLYEEMMGDRANRHSRTRYSHFMRQPEPEPEETYQARLRKERAERAAAEDRRLKEEHAAKLRKLEERQRAIEEAAARRKNKAKQKKASSEQSKRAAEQLLRKQNDHMQSRRSQVFAAARLGQEEVVKAGIWESGVDAAGPENSSPGFKETLLHIAVSKNSLSLVSWLDAHNAEPDECNSDGLTPFMLAVKLGHVEIMHHFLDSYSPRDDGPVFRGRANSNISLLNLALRTRKPEVVWIILDRGLSSEGQTRTEWNWLSSAQGKLYLAANDQEALYEEMRDLFTSNVVNLMDAIRLEESSDPSPENSQTSKTSMPKPKPMGEYFKRKEDHRASKKRQNGKFRS